MQRALISVVEHRENRRSLRRSHERADFWRWLLGYRRTYPALLLQAIAEHAPAANALIVRNPRDAERLLSPSYDVKAPLGP